MLCATGFSRFASDQTEVSNRRKLLTGRARPAKGGKMARITIHAGDFTKGDGAFNFGSFVLKNEYHTWIGETNPVTDLASVDIASEERVKKVGGTIGWGAAGMLLLGPVGLLAGLLLGGKQNEVTFVAQFKDGRKLLATTDSGTYKQFMAAVFQLEHTEEAKPSRWADVKPLPPPE